MELSKTGRGAVHKSIVARRNEIITEVERAARDPEAIGGVIPATDEFNIVDPRAVPQLIGEPRDRINRDDAIKLKFCGPC